MKEHAYFLVLVLFSFLLFEIFFVLVLFLFAKSNKMFAKSNEKNSVFELEIFSVLVLFLFSILKVFRVLVLFLFENKNMFANMFPNNMRVLSSLVPTLLKLQANLVLIIAYVANILSTLLKADLSIQILTVDPMFRVQQNDHLLELSQKFTLIRFGPKWPL